MDQHVLRVKVLVVVVCAGRIQARQSDWRPTRSPRMNRRRESGRRLLEKGKLLIGIKE
jgi:hypothetical protein